MTPSLDTLRDLQRRVAAASGADRELANEICVSLTGGYAGEPDTSIDAAVALVERTLPGWSYEVMFWPGGDERGSCLLLEVGPDGWRQGGMQKINVSAATPPLAICSALLSALISRAETAKAEG